MSGHSRRQPSSTWRTCSCTLAWGLRLRRAPWPFCGEPLARSSARCGRRLCHRTALGRLPDDRRRHSRSPLGPSGAYRSGAGRSGAAGSIRAKAAPLIPKSIRNLVGRAAGLSTLGAHLPPRVARSERPHLEPRWRSRLDERRRRRPEIAVLPILRRRPTPAASSPRISSWIPKRCGECHKDIYQQWKSSMHHFASFNNQFYRKSDRVHAETSSGTQAEQVVRGMPRSRRVLQRPLRPAHQGADRHAGSAERPGLHVLPRHRARRRHDGQRRISRSSIRRCTSWLRSRQSAAFKRWTISDLSQSRAAPRAPF